MIYIYIWRRRYIQAQNSQASEYNFFIDLKILFLLLWLADVS